jgi:NADH-ubiquinone oxidoreductase chain 2
VFIYKINPAALRKVLVYEYPSSEVPSQAKALKKIIFNTFLCSRTKIINKMGEHLKIIEYPLILLFIISGAVFLMSTNDIVSIFLSIELQSYGLYILSTIYRNSELSTTGGLMYFLLGALSSCFILLGSALLYSNSGTTSLDGLYVINSISSDVNYNITS